MSIGGKALKSKVDDGLKIVKNKLDNVAGGAKQIADDTTNQIVIEPDKFKYIFGEVASGTHNTQRSLQNVAQMNRIGIHNTLEGQDYLTQHLIQVAKNKTSVVRNFSKTLPNGRAITLQVRESLLSGPGGFLKIESTWKILDNGYLQLSTIIPFGG